MDHILSLSYGKDSIAAIHVAVDILQWPLDRIIHAEVWATDTIPADLPLMMEFKDKANRIIRDRWGIEVEHVRGPYTFEQGFYLRRGRTGRKTKFDGKMYGWPMVRGQWCLQQLKLPALAKAAPKGAMQYLGIAADEPERIARHINRPGIKLPLVEAGWTEAMCRQWCEENDLLSPIYTDSARGGCWFCHNQGVDQLRLLRKNYPERWALMLKWDKDSPVTFHADGHTVHDFEERFALEDVGQITAGDTRFRWDSIDQMSCFMEDDMPYIKRNTLEIGQRYRTVVGKGTTLRVVDILPPENKGNRYEQVTLLDETTGKKYQANRKVAELLILEPVKED